MVTSPVAWLSACDNAASPGARTILPRVLTILLGIALAATPGPALATDLTPTATTLSIPAVVSYPVPVNATGTVSPATSGRLFARSGDHVFGWGHVGGTANFSVLVPPGSHAIYGQFEGNSTHASSSSAATQVNSYVHTSTYLKATPSLGRFGQRLELYALTEVSGSYRLTGGTLSIVDAQTNETLASAVAGSGPLELRTEFQVFGTGNHTFEARYTGHGLLAPSSRQVAVFLSQWPTTVTVSVPANPVYPGPFQIEAQILPAPEAGAITFYRSNDELATVPLDRQGRASMETTISPGPGFIRADFSGSPGFAPNWSLAAFPVRVATSVELSSAPASPTAGESVTLHARLTSLGGAPPADGGTLRIVNATTNAVIASRAVSATAQELETEVTLPAGNHPIKASYVPYGHYLASEAQLVVAVGQAPDTTPPVGSVTINGGTPYTRQASVTLNLSATDPTPASGVSGMSFSASGLAGSWTTWEPYATTRSWTLSGGDGQRSVYVRYRDAAGNVSAPSSASIVLDTQPPVGRGPTVSFPVGSTIGSNVPVAVDFATTDAGSGVASYSLAQSSNGGSSWSAVAVAAGQTVVRRNLAPGTTAYRFRTRAIDLAGNQSKWSLGPAFSVLRLQESAAAVSYSGSWVTKRKAAASGGKMRRSASAGARARLSFTGRSVGFVTRVGPNMGRAGIFLDGKQVTTLDLYAPSAGWRHVAFSEVFDSSAAHKLEIRVLGTKSPASTGAVVIVDAFVVIQ